MSCHSPLGLVLRRMRDERGLTQAKMAAALSVPGYWLSKVEGGREEMTEVDLADAADFLDASDAERVELTAAWEASRLPVAGRRVATASAERSAAIRAGVPVTVEGRDC